jgi:hypothetical protein
MTLERGRQDFTKRGMQGEDCIKRRDWGEAVGPPRASRITFLFVLLCIGIEQKRGIVSISAQRGPGGQETSLSYPWTAKWYLLARNWAWILGPKRAVWP